jgi:hypothetical protein
LVSANTQFCGSTLGTYANIRRYKIWHRKWINECTPIVEQDKQDAKAKPVVGSEELTMCAIRELLVVSVECTTILERVVLCGGLDCVIEYDIGKTDDAVAYQF